MAAAEGALEVREVEPTPSLEISIEERSLTASDGTTSTRTARAASASTSASTSNDLSARGGGNGPDGGDEPESNRQNDHYGDGGAATLRIASSSVPSATAGVPEKTSRNTSSTGTSTGASSECARRWSKLRLNFRLAALRSIAQDKREALKKLQEVRKRADRAQEAQSDSRTCKICWDRTTNTVCLDCGHQCMCTRCGACMTFCPICMQDISDLVELQL